MEQRHAVLLTIAVTLFALATALELGSGLLPEGTGSAECAVQPATSAACKSIQTELGNDPDRIAEAVALADGGSPPGYGIRYLAMLDIVLLATLALIAAHVWLPPAVLSRVQGAVMLISGIVVLIWAIAGGMMVLGLVTLMIGLLLAAPFGTAFYFATYGFFPVEAAAAMLSLVMLLKLGACACLALAHHRYLKIKSLVAMVACSLLTTFVVGFLHGFVPMPVVSITDGIAAIVVALIASIWAVYAVVGGLKGVVKAIA